MSVIYIIIFQGKIYYLCTDSACVKFVGFNLKVSHPCHANSY
jgi:hypothetical protein